MESAVNTKDIANTEPELWDANSPVPLGSKGIYVAISGNTGAGKSTLIRHVVERARNLGMDILGISERTLHHPYLRRMFSDPSHYAFPIQLNFMLQRYLILYRQMELGRIVFMERSHLDDALFVREHQSEGNISPAQLATYNSLAQILHDQIPVPDLFILLNPKPEISIERVRLAEQKGDRPVEFPNEAAKEQWIHRWYRLYETFHSDLPLRLAREQRAARTRLLTLNPETSQEEQIHHVMCALNEVRSALCVI
jgi:deoxyadenosine/deoxycytidine kinase